MKRVTIILAIIMTLIINNNNESKISINRFIGKKIINKSKADFRAKINIALKESNETSYWLKLMYRTDYISNTEYTSMYKDLDEIISILTAICKTTENKI